MHGDEPRALRCPAACMLCTARGTLPWHRTGNTQQGARTLLYYLLLTRSLCDKGCLALYRSQHTHTHSQCSTQSCAAVLCVRLRGHGVGQVIAHMAAAWPPLPLSRIHRQVSVSHVPAHMFWVAHVTWVLQGSQGACLLISALLFRWLLSSTNQMPILVK